VADPARIDGLGPAAPATGPAAPRPTPPTGGAAFGDVLAAKLQSAPLAFSGHAQQRIAQRGIPVDAQTMSRLDGGVQRAASKGARSALVLVDDSAFVVSVPNKTVITAVDREHMREQVFTNIDSAVIA
jgi:flagellar operon protein